MKLFFEKFRYHYKRYLAIIFTSIAIGFLLADFIINLLLMIQNEIAPGFSTLSFVWNFVILMICFVMLLRGNSRQSSIAFQGVLSFIFLSIILLAYELIFQIIYGTGFSFSGVNAVFAILIILGIVGMIVLGILCYLRLKGYLSGSYSNLKRIKIDFTIFLVILILWHGLTIGFEFYLGGIAGWVEILLVLLTPISELFGAAACLFTIYRLNE